MLKDLRTLIRQQDTVLNHYLKLAFCNGLFVGLTSLLLIPMVTNLLQQQFTSAAICLGILISAIIFCHMWRIKVEKAGIKLGVTVLSEGRRVLGEHVSALPIGWFNQEHSKKLNHAITQGVMEIAQLPAHVLTPFISGGTSLIIITLGLLLVNWPVGIIAVIALPTLVVVAYGANKLSQNAHSNYHQQSIETGNRVLEFAQTQAVIRAFNTEGASSRLLQQSFLNHKRKAHKTILTTSLCVLAHQWVTQLAFLAMFALVLWSLQSQSTPQATDISWLVLTFILMSRYIDPLLDMGGYSEVIRSGKRQLRLLMEILETPTITNTDFQALPDVLEDHSIVFNQVDFYYPNTSKPAIKDVSFCAPHHKMTAIVGASGAGKSTILQLIARFYEAEQGHITLGNHPINALSFDDYIRQVAIIFQDGYLFQTSILDNILLGNPEADDSELNAVIEQAGLASTIARLPQGIHAQVGEGGALLSGGERQRVNIARALIKQAPILLVDEATASLDSENQAIISQTLARLKDQCTIIVIAHQLATIRAADHIVVMEQGAVIEQGSQATLVASDGYFKTLLDLSAAARNWQITATNVGETRDL